MVNLTVQLIGWRGNPQRSLSHTILLSLLQDLGKIEHTIADQIVLLRILIKASNIE